MVCAMCWVAIVGQRVAANMALSDLILVDPLDQAGLKFTMSSDPPFNPVHPPHIGHGDFITYSLTLSNTGTLSVTDIMITNVVPLGSSSVVSSWAPSPQRASPLVWQLAALTPGEMMTLQHTLRVNDFVTVTAIVNTAIASGHAITPMARTIVHPFGITSAPEIAYYFPLLLKS